jgi:hypothetical protein
MDPSSDSNQSPDAAWWTSLRRVMNRVIDGLESAASTDAQLRADLARLLGRADAAAPPGIPSPDAPPATPQASPTPPPLPRTEPPTPRQPFVPARAVLLGPREVAVPAAAQFNREPLPFDPPTIARRCRFKAEATRWQSERSRRLDTGEDVSEGDRELVSRARSSNTYLWMVSPNKWRERSEDAFAVVAGCYEALADAVELMELADRLGREQEAAMKLLAEAQSSVRAACEDYSSTGRDEDQSAVFFWLRRETDVRQIWVQYMQLEHPAPPDNFADLRARIALLRESLSSLRERDDNVRKLLKKIAYHVQQITERVDPADGDGASRLSSDDHHYRSIATAIEALLAAQVQPSDSRLRDALIELAPRFPEEVSPAVDRVLAAIEDYLDRVGGDDEEEQKPARDEDDELVAAARAIVQGRDAVLIGGQPVEAHRTRLEQGLGLKSLNWVRVAHHEPFTAAESAIARPGVGLVLIMTRWRSHRDGPAARAACRAAGVPLVELPAGYNLRQVAHRIVAQLSPERESLLTN